jgi:hypothetical protein
VAAGLHVSKGNQSTKVYHALASFFVVVEISNLNFPEKPSRISTIFYFGLEGLGGLDMETNENDDVCPQLTANSQH